MLLLDHTNQYRYVSLIPLEGIFAIRLGSME